MQKLLYFDRLSKNKIPELKHGIAVFKCRKQAIKQIIFRSFS